MNSMDSRNWKYVFIETAKDHFETMMLPKLTAISEEVVSHMLVFVEGSVAYGFCDEKSDVDIDYYIKGV